MTSTACEQPVPGSGPGIPPSGPPRASREPLFYAVATLAFLACTGATLYFCRSMNGGMEMPGGWTMSMMWMPMPDQTWPAAAFMFLLMWLSMMVAMMLPSALPMLLIYRRVLHFRRERRVGLSTALMACGYFAVWLCFGMLAYLGGAAAAWAAMRWPLVSRAVPFVSGAALILCGVFQWTPWKMACLRHCRDPLHLVASHLSGGLGGGWRLGIHHGAFCAACCWGLMLIQLVLGVMNLAVMAIVATVIALEKLVPRVGLIVRIVGAASVAAGLWLLLRAITAGGRGS